MSTLIFVTEYEVFKNLVGCTYSRLECHTDALSVVGSLLTPLMMA